MYFAPDKKVLSGGKKQTKVKFKKLISMDNKKKCEDCTKFHYTSIHHGWCSFLRMEIRGKSILAGKCKSFKISNLKN